MKTIIQALTATVMVAVFLIAVGTIGAYELDTITAGTCVLRFAACALSELILGVCTNLINKEN